MNIFMDMDGVIAVYERDAYTCRAKIDPTNADGHYFGTCAVDARAAEIARTLTSRGADPKFITGVCGASAHLALAQRDDKSAWLIEHGFGKHKNPLIACVRTTDTQSKADWLTRVLGYPLDRNDVLIDDYNNELHAWARAGGVAIKYCNGYSNSPDTWRGLKIMPDDTASDVIELIALISSERSELRFRG